MNVICRGVRGSIPVPGAHTSRYGGNSSCIEVRAKDGPPLVLDCGTGARALGLDLLKERVEHVEVFFTHFHMDHLFGFPFFGPIYSPSCTLNVNLPAYTGVDAQNKLARYLNGIYHPVRIADLPSKTSFHGVRPGMVVERGPYKLKGVALNHPGGSCGYRIEAEGKVVVYLTDTAPMTPPDKGVSADLTPPPPERRLLDAMHEADLVIMDTMFSYDEYLERMTWGHAYPEYGVKLAKLAGVKHLVLFHHSPDASDEQLDSLAEYWSNEEALKVSVAMENKVIDLSG
ncbi:MAG: MBL fold metallo-hydrolase [Myxococcota bacterium]|nr:MBL fold metallo-hydrolase [Myxococcota bacterium]